MKIVFLQFQVALDERNLKRAVNRYGTMPKGARIGAYLESLRQSGMTPEPVTEQGVESDATVDSSSLHASESMDRSMVGRSSKAHQMLRSNSSHGSFSGANNNGMVQMTTTASSSKNPSNSQVRRVQQGSLERSFGGGQQPHHHHQPLPMATTMQGPPDFEFPPPPLDLPPPSPSPRTARRAAMVTDKENLPERLERSASKGGMCICRNYKLPNQNFLFILKKKERFYSTAFFYLHYQL